MEKTGSVALPLTALGRFYLLTFMHMRPRPSDLETAAQDIATALLQSDLTVVYDGTLRRVAYLSLALDCRYQSDPAFRVSNAYAFAVEQMNEAGLVALTTATEAIRAGLPEGTPADMADVVSRANTAFEDDPEAPDTLHRVTRDRLDLVHRPTEHPRTKGSVDDNLILSTDLLWERVNKGCPILSLDGQPTRRRSRTPSDDEQRKQAIYLALRTLCHQHGGVMKVVEYLSTPEGRALREGVDQELAANPTKKSGKGKRKIRDVVEAAMATHYRRKDRKTESIS